KLGCLFQVPVTEDRCIRTTRTGCYLRTQRIDRQVTRGPTVCDHRGVSVILRRRRSARRRGERVTNAHVLKSSSVRRWMSQGSREGLAAFNECLTPHILLHSLRPGNPWATRFAPARRARNRLFHSQLIGECGRVFESVF